MEKIAAWLVAIQFPITHVMSVSHQEMIEKKSRPLAVACLGTCHGWASSPSLRELLGGTSFALLQEVTGELICDQKGTQTNDSNTRQIRWQIIAELHDPTTLRALPQPSSITRKRLGKPHGRGEI